MKNNDIIQNLEKVISELISREDQLKQYVIEYKELNEFERAMVADIKAKTFRICIDRLKLCLY